MVLEFLDKYRYAKRNLFLSTSSTLFMLSFKVYEDSERDANVIICEYDVCLVSQSRALREGSLVVHILDQNHGISFFFNYF